METGLFATEKNNRSTHPGSRSTRLTPLPGRRSPRAAVHASSGSSFRSSLRPRFTHSGFLLSPKREIGAQPVLGTRAMAAWTETARSVVSPWECDVTEHFTIAYYFDRLMDAASTIAAILGLCVK